MNDNLREADAARTHVCVCACVCTKENRETGAQSETKSEGDSICSLSHEMVLVSLGRAKIYLCQAALNSPRL